MVIFSYFSYTSKTSLFYHFIAYQLGLSDEQHFVYKENAEKKKNSISRIHRYMQVFRTTSRCSRNRNLICTKFRTRSLFVCYNKVYCRRCLHALIKN